MTDDLDLSGVLVDEWKARSRFTSCLTDRPFTFIPSRSAGRWER